MNTILKSLGTLKLKIHPRDLREAVDQYLTLRASQNLRKSSYSQIRCNLKQMVSRFHPSRCDEITTTMMEDWFQVKEWKRSTIDRVIAKVGPFLNWCIRESYCIYNPLKYIILPKKDDSKPVIFTVEATGDLLKWNQVETLQGTGSAIQFTDTREALFEKQYYRVKTLE